MVLNGAEKWVGVVMEFSNSRALTRTPKKKHPNLWKQPYLAMTFEPPPFRCARRRRLEVSEVPVQAGGRHRREALSPGPLGDRRSLSLSLVSLMWPWILGF